MSDQSSSKAKLKLLIDRKNEKVLFAETTKEVVDALFSLTSLPLRMFVTLLDLKKSTMVGSIRNLCNTIPLGDQTYVQSSKNVESALNTKNKELYMCLHEQESSDDSFCCSNSRLTIAYHPHVAEDPNTACPTCKKTMRCKLQLVESGCAKERMSTYMVMDNLEVKPMSAICSISLIKSFNFKDLTSLEEKVVSFGMEEGLRILELSLHSKEVLTGVYLCN